MIIIPAIDLKDGQCVRLRRGDMQAATVYAQDPLIMAERWVQAGAQRLHLVDLNGAIEGKPININSIQAIIRTFPQIDVQVGGGIRDLVTIKTYVDLGARYIIIGTQAVKQPELIINACQLYPGKIIVGIDAKDGKVATEGWVKVSKLEAIKLAKDLESYGVAAIIYTDIARDGMLQGVNLAATRRLAQAVSIPIIASGGVTNLEDIKQLCSLEQEGIMGAIVGRALYENTLDFAAAQALCNQYK